MNCQLMVYVDVVDSIEAALRNADSLGYAISGVVFSGESKRVRKIVRKAVTDQGYAFSEVRGLVPMIQNPTGIYPTGMYPWKLSAWYAVENQDQKEREPWTFFVSRSTGYRHESSTEWFDPNCTLCTPTIEIDF